MEKKLISQSKKNLRDYRVIEKFIAGIVLTGNEIKSLRNYQSSIDESYIFPQQQELYVLNMHVAAYKYSHAVSLAQSYNTRKRRKLLLKKREIKKIVGQVRARSYVVIPLKLFFNDRGWAKLEIALAQRLKKYQIKEKVKEKELKRKLRNEILY
jgi:SsrA-binding protein